MLLGPSGCGKTTLLRSIAGLERPDAGAITIQGEIVYSRSQGIFVPPHLRRVGMVFQNYALWPHMNVSKNVSYPLRMQKINAETVRQQVAEMIRLVQLDGLEHRYPHELSGGQQQRAALARALAMNPGLLLLDEPLSSLDAILREEMREELKRIHNETKLTMLYVTHDQKEAVALADRIGVMDNGRLVQLGPALEVYTTPTSEFVAEFTGASNVIRGVVLTIEGRKVLQFSEENFPLLPDMPQLTLGQGIFAIRPEDIWMHDERPGLLAIVESSSHLGGTIEYRVRSGDLCLLVHASPHYTYQPGQRLYIGINHIAPLGQRCRHRHRKGCKGSFISTK